MIEREEYIEEDTLNSMVPIWRKNKQELTEEDYNNFYFEKRFGFDKPLKHMHISVDGMISYNSILVFQKIYHMIIIVRNIKKV